MLGVTVSADVGILGVSARTAAGMASWGVGVRAGLGILSLAERAEEGVGSGGKRADNGSGSCWGGHNGLGSGGVEVRGPAVEELFVFWGGALSVVDLE